MAFLCHGWASAECGVRGLGGRERSRWVGGGGAMQPQRVLQLWMTGCSGDRDRAETRDGEGAGGSELLNRGLDITPPGGAPDPGTC